MGIALFKIPQIPHFIHEILKLSSIHILLIQNTIFLNKNLLKFAASIMKNDNSSHSDFRYYLHIYIFA